MPADDTPVVRRWAVAGLLAGLAVGLVLGVPGGGEELVKPLLVPLLGAAGGALLGAGVGTASRALGGNEPRRRRGGSTRVRAAEREPVEAERGPPPLPADLPVPAAALDGAQAPEGWYPDPLDDTEQRWWDGEAWTGHTWRPRRRG